MKKVEGFGRIGRGARFLALLAGVSLFACGRLGIDLEDVMDQKGTGEVDATDSGPDSAATDLPVSDSDQRGSEPMESPPETICYCECPCEGSIPADSDTTPSSVLDPGDDTVSNDPSDTDSSWAEPSDSDLPLVGTDTGTGDRAATPCLIISEYVEGSGWNKGIEIFNCGMDETALEGTSVCVYTNEAIECSSAESLTGSLPVGGVLTVCHGSQDLLGRCDITSGAVNFSGNDRVALLYEGTVIDAFGALAVQPEGSPWSNVTFDRCQGEAWLGVGEFSPEAFFLRRAADDVSGFGLPPVLDGCDAGDLTEVDGDE